MMIMPASACAVVIPIIQNRLSFNFKALIVNQQRNISMKKLHLFLSCLLFPVMCHAQAQHITKYSNNIVQINTLTTSGSGIVYTMDERWLVITNRHIVTGYNEFKINVMHDIDEPAKPGFVAELVGYSADYDLAILEITQTINHLPIEFHDCLCDDAFVAPCFYDINLFDPDHLVSRGDHIGILGFPGLGNNELIYSSGIVSALRYETYGDNRYLVWIRTDAQISPGSSGGIAFDDNGVAIGMPTFVSMEEVTGARLGSILSFNIIEMVLDRGHLSDSWDSFTEMDVFFDHGFEPEYGTISLRSGFYPGSYALYMMAGGINSVEELGDDCIGYAALRPDLSINWTGETDRFHIEFVADQQTDDAILIVKSPDGVWHCNDDAHDATLDPYIEFNSPIEGRYDIWVGSHDPEENFNGFLFITEDAERDVHEDFDWRLVPYYGTAHLSSGLFHDPHELIVLAGGEINVAESGIDSNCMGFVTGAPAYRLNWLGDSKQLFFNYVAYFEDDDPILIVRSPDGSWYCNDSAHLYTLNPQVFIANPLPGQYDIWVGTYDEEDLIYGDLIITEIIIDVP